MRTAVLVRECVRVYASKNQCVTRKVCVCVFCNNQPYVLCMYILLGQHQEISMVYSQRTGHLSYSINFVYREKYNPVARVIFFDAVALLSKTREKTL